jgi:hypothetical protein
MFVVSSESFTNFSFDCDVPRETILDEVVVTGTHSAGKTTLLSDYGCRTEMLEEAADYKLPSGFTAGYEYVEGVVVPVVIAPEAATRYASTVAKNSRTLTDMYTLEHQIGIESIAQQLMVRANVVAAHLSHRLQPNMSTPVAIVASDRSQLDGHVYSSVRLPEAEQEEVDMAVVAKATGGSIPKITQGAPFAIEKRPARLLQMILASRLLPTTPKPLLSLQNTAQTILNLEIE